ncbi:MAG: hypothetical protein QXN55_00880 [Candidatus Nitrosotenuis sp.]
MKKRIPPLQIEFLQDRTNLFTLSLIEYKRENFLTVIDNITTSEIGAYVLDYAAQSNVDIQQFMRIVNVWFYKSSSSYPISIEIAKLGLTGILANMYRSFDVNFVARVLGNPFKYDLSQPKRVKRRRVIPIQEGIPIRLKNQSVVAQR